MNFAIGDGKLLRIGDYVEPAPEPIRVIPLPQVWFILRTRPLKEFKVRDSFADNGISFYLPAITQRVARYRRHDRAACYVNRRVPLFPGMMFIPDFEVTRLASLRSVAGVAGLLHLGGRPARLTPESIGFVRMIEADLQTPRRQRQPRYVNGDTVRITWGPFEGWKGRIGRLDGNGRIRVLIDVVKRAISVDVTEDQVEPDGLQPRWSDGSTG